eukprot:5410815-Prymnesium_polylepis.1
MPHARPGAAARAVRSRSRPPLALVRLERDALREARRLRLLLRVDLLDRREQLVARPPLDARRAARARGAGAGAACWRCAILGAPRRALGAPKRRRVRRLAVVVDPARALLDRRVAHLPTAAGGRRAAA